MREVKATFVKLLELLAEPVSLYGAEVWGVEDSNQAGGNVQMFVTRIYLGVGSLHPLVFRHFEIYLLTNCTNSTIGNWWKKPTIYIVEGAVELVQ